MNKAPSISPKGESPFPPHPSISPKGESPNCSESSPLGGIRGGLLRALEPEDLPLLYTIENDPAMWDVGATATPYSRHALRHHIQAMGADINECGELRFVIEYAGQPVGLVDLTNYDARALRAEVSIALLRKYRGQGIGLEALQELESHCRRYLHLHQLYALVPEGNAASSALFQSAGYTHTFDIPDWHFINGTYLKAAFFQKIL